MVYLNKKPSITKGSITETDVQVGLGVDLSMKRTSTIKKDRLIGDELTVKDEITLTMALSVSKLSVSVGKAACCLILGFKPASPDCLRVNA